MTIEYRVKKVERFIVTRYEYDENQRVHTNADVRQIGNEFSNADTAYEVGYALARQEAEIKGFGPFDDRITYPVHPREVKGELVNGSLASPIAA